MLETITSHLKTALVTTCAIAALAGYAQHKGVLDIRVYTSEDEAYQARLVDAAREAFPHVEYPERSEVPASPAKPSKEHKYASLWDDFDHLSKRR
jgi:hypothetical protein